MGAWTVWKFKGGLGKKKSGVFYGDIDTPISTMNLATDLHFSNLMLGVKRGKFLPM